MSSLHVKPHVPALQWSSFHFLTLCVFEDWTVVLLAGGVAGMTGWSVGTPMDVIKARLQMDGAREQKRYRGFVHCVTETARVEGPAIFFKSLGINCLRAFPVNMVVFAVYELALRVLRKQDSVTYV